MLASPRAWVLSAKRKGSAECRRECVSQCCRLCSELCCWPVVQRTKMSVPQRHPPTRQECKRKQRKRGLMRLIRRRRPRASTLIKPATRRVRRKPPQTRRRTRRRTPWQTRSARRTNCVQPKSARLPNAPRPNRHSRRGAQGWHAANAAKLKRRLFEPNEGPHALYTEHEGLSFARVYLNSAACRRRTRRNTVDR